MPSIASFTNWMFLISMALDIDPLLGFRVRRGGVRGVSRAGASTLDHAPGPLVFRASDAGRWVTGHNLRVTGVL